MYRVIATVLALALVTIPALAQSDKPRAGGPRPHISPVAPPVTTFRSKYGKGTIIVDTKRRRLLYVLSRSKAYLYPVSVGRQGFQWSGTERITAKKNWPTWRPPAEMRKRQPNLPKVMSGGLNNPLGAKALYLGSSLYRIHGTSNTRGIGSANSSGCIRMHNAHVTHLSRLAKIGTKVVVLKALPNRVARPFAGTSTASIKVASATSRPRRKPDLSWRRAILGD